MTDDLERRVRAARPRSIATAPARDRARAAALGALGDRAAGALARRTSRLALAVAGLAAAATAAAVAIALVLAGGDGEAPRIILPGDDAPTAPARPPAGGTRPGVAASVVLRPAAGLDADAAYEGFARVVRARASRSGHAVEVARVDRDRALVTLYGTRESQQLQSVVTGSAVAVYDLDRVLVQTSSGLPAALRRARELAPDAPARMAWYVRPGGAVRGPAPRAADLRTASMPADAEILELPEGYAILRRQYVRNARGDAERLRPAEYMLVRDEPTVSPLQVLGVAEESADDDLPGRPLSVRLRLSADGREAWDRTLRDVSARAAGLGRPQRVVVTTNGDVWQTTTADAGGRLDTRPGSPAFEFGSFMSSTLGNGLRSPIQGDLPTDGSVPAVVWVSDFYRVGPPPVVRGVRVSPLPPQVRAAVAGGGFGADRSDPSTVRRAVQARGPDGTWAVWSYLSTAGSERNVVTGPRRDDGFGFICGLRGAIANCGGTRGLQIYAVPPAAATLRFLLPGGRERLADAVGNGWAILVGPRRTATAAGPAVRVEALDASGRVVGRLTERVALP